MSDTTIKTELTLEDLASAVLKEIRGETEKTGEAAEHAKEGFMHFARETVTVLHELGINVTEVTEKVYEFGKSFIEVAAEGEKADTALAGMMSTTQDLRFGEVIEDARKLGDEMDEIGAKTGAIGDVGQAFNQLTLYTGATEKGVEKASDQIYGLAQIARVMGKDVGAVTQEYSLMQEGMVKAKGQLFQLFQSTGYFGDNAKKAAAAWGQLTEEKRVEILDAALNKITGKFKDIPQTFDNQVSSLKHMMEAAKEKIGEPFMAAVVPALQMAIDKVGVFTPRLVHLAEVLGTNVGHWVTEGLKLAEEGFKYLDDHADEIKKALSDAWADAKQVWTFIKSVVQFIADNMEGIQALAAIYAGSQAAKMGGNLMASIADSTGKVTAMGVAATAAQVGLSLLAAAAIQYTEKYLAAKERQDILSKEQGTQFNERVSHYADTGQYGKLEELQREHMHRQQTGTTPTNEISSDAIRDAISTAKDRVMIEALNSKSVIHQAQDFIAQAHADAAAKHTASANEYAQAVVTAQTNRILMAYNQAVVLHDEATQHMIESVVTNSKDLHSAFDASTLEIEGGMLGMMKAAQRMGDAAMSGAISGLEAAKPAIGGLTGSGNVTINLKQDFRNQDPDRIAVAFERSIEKMAETRKSATTGVPYL